MGGGGSKAAPAEKKADTTKEQEHLETSIKSRVSGQIKEGEWSDYYIRKQDLGSGMSGVVFLVQSKNDASQTYACKSIAKARLHEGEVEALRKEIALCASLDHPNIVKIVESFESPKDITMIMECCQGGELYDSLVDEGEYSQSRAAELFQQMAQAVNYCHQMGVVHRDLKLENFVFENKPASESTLKLIDFGLSVKHRASAGIQKMKSVVGTAYYMAPEVLDSGEAYDAKCDVWSLGVILYMMLTGSPPFNGSSEKMIMRRAATGKVDWQPWKHGSQFDGAKDLITKILVPAEQRLDAAQVLQHPWLKERKQVKKDMIPTTVTNALWSFSKRGKLYRSSAQIVAVRMSPQEINGLRQQFHNMDADHSGTISSAEFANALKQSSSGKLSDEECDEMFKRCVRACLRCSSACLPACLRALRACARVCCFSGA
jgi:calcium-dependent protein kinase